ncbi:MAG: tetratricopeptide repeat protein [Armatimonadetes bacterium]|nr:tetratricopeptide repeat protein [Armatimonadota bacterium]
MPATKRKKVLHPDSKPAIGKLSRQEWLVITLVLVVAVTFRIIYLIQYKAHIPYYSVLVGDSSYYDSWAQRITAGKGYGQLPFYLAPLYPYLLAMIYGIAGHKLVVVYIFQAILGVFNIMLVYLLGRRLFGHWVGIVSMMLLLFYAPVAYLESKLLSETLGITLSLSSMFLLLLACDQPSPFKFLVVGILLGLSAICRPVMSIFIVFVLVWLYFNKYRNFSRIFIPLLAGISLAMLPVTARNYAVSGEFVPISTNYGMTFWHGNNPEAIGICAIPSGLTTSIMEQQKEEMALATKALGREVTASESSAYWLGRGLSFIREHPVAYICLFGKKVVWSVHNREAPCNYNFYLERKFVPALRALFIPFWAIFGLGVLGYVLSRREGIRESGLLAIYALSVFVGLLVFFVSSRYRAPAVPALAVLAGFGVVRIIDSFCSRNLKVLTVAALCVIPSALVLLVPYPVPPITAEGPANMGYSFMEMGRYNDAVVQFREAIKLNPSYEYARDKLGEALVQAGRYVEAMDVYSDIAADHPNSAEAQNNLGAVVERLGMLDAAVMRYSMALHLDPDFAVARYNLALVLARQGKLDEAISHFLKLSKTNPSDPNVYYCLGLMYKRKGKLDDAESAYRKAIYIKPDLAEAHNNLAVVLFEKGNYASALKEVELAQKYGIKPNPDFIKALSKKLSGRKIK